jgi:hypothetical protein
MSCRSPRRRPVNSFTDGAVQAGLDFVVSGLSQMIFNNYREIVTTEEAGTGITAAQNNQRFEGVLSR